MSNEPTSNAKSLESQEKGLKTQNNEQEAMPSWKTFPTGVIFITDKGEVLPPGTAEARLKKANMSYYVAHAHYTTHGSKDKEAPRDYLTKSSQIPTLYHMKRLEDGYYVIDKILHYGIEQRW